jgi:sulfoxide reductase heme-binding subunit YedZ
MTKAPAKRGFLNPRIRRRLVAHHLPLAVVAANLIFAILLLVPGGGSHVGLSIATAYAGLIFLAVTLAIGPLNLLRGLRNPVSSDLRRDIGIWAAILGLLHVLVSLPLPSGNILFLFVRDAGQQIAIAPRTDLIGLANDLGLLATLLTILLLLLSNDWSLTFFGAKRWKSLQRWSYVLIALVVAHGFGYILQEHRQSTLLDTFILTTAAVVLLQGAGYLVKRRKLKSRSEAAAARTGGDGAAA